MSIISIERQTADVGMLDDAFAMAVRVLAAHERGELSHAVTAWALNQAAEQAEWACRERRSWIDGRSPRQSGAR